MSKNTCEFEPEAGWKLITLTLPKFKWSIKTVLIVFWGFDIWVCGIPLLKTEILLFVLNMVVL
jgi:hypothetical protein